MTAADLLADLRARGVVLTANGDRLAYDAPAGTLTPEIIAALKADKTAILRVLAPKPSGCAWREDERGRLIFSDGTIYAPTRSGGYAMVKHPARRMTEPGTFEVSP